MSIKLMKAIWDNRECLDLNGIETAILVKLADFASDDGSSVYPSLGKLVKTTGFSESTIQRALKSLCVRNFLTQVSKFSQRKHLTNIYKINAQALYVSTGSGQSDTILTQNGHEVVVRETRGSSQPDYRALVTETIGSSQSDYRAVVTETPPLVTETTGSSQSDYLSIIEPLTEPNTFLRVPENFRQIDGVVANAPLPLPSEGASVFSSDQTVSGECSFETDCAEKPKQPPSGGLEFHRGTLSKADVLKNSDSGISLEEDREYDHFLEDISAEETPPPVCTEQAFYDSLEALRVSASRDWDRDAIPPENPVLETPPKTASFSASEPSPLSIIKSEQKTAVDHKRTSAIDMSIPDRETEKSVPSPKRKKSPKPSPEILDQQFADWYAVYPRKESRKKAFQYFKAALKIMDFERLLELTKLFARSCEGKKKDFIPHPATWLHQERWEDVEVPQEHQTASTVSNNPQQTPILDPSLQAFVDSHPKLGTNAFAFSACKVFETQDRVILQASSQFYLDKVDLYQAELEKYYGKRVELTLTSRESPKDRYLETSPSIADSNSQSISQKEHSQEDITKDVRIPCRRLGRPVYQLAIKNIIKEIAFSKAPSQRLAIQGVAA